MLVLTLDMDEEIVLEDAETGKELARIIRCDRHPNKRLGFIASKEEVRIYRVSRTRLETAGAAI